MLNACELEIDLFCRGLRLPPGVSLEGARPIASAAAGVGSGLELVIPTASRLKSEIWMNAPVAESFVKQSPYELAARPVVPRPRSPGEPHVPRAAARAAVLAQPP